MKKVILTILVTTAILSSTTLSFAQSRGMCNLKVAPPIKYYKNTKELYRIVEGKFDSTSRKWWVDTLAVMSVVTIFGGIFTIEWFSEETISYDRYLDGDTKMDALKEFTKLKNTCRKKLKRMFPKGTLTKVGNVYHNGFLYRCDELGVNGLVGQSPVKDVQNGDGYQYFANINRYKAKRNFKKLKALKCKKIEMCLLTETDSVVEYNRLEDFKLKLGCRDI